MKKFILLLPLMFGCATYAALNDYKADTDARWAEVEAGTLTAEEAARMDREQLNEIKAEVAEGYVTGNPWADVGIGSLLAAIAAYFGVNKRRDAKRLARGEPVAILDKTQS